MSGSDRSRAQFLFSIMVSGFDNVHIRANVPRLEQAIKYGQSAGDRIYTSFSTVCSSYTRQVRGLFCAWIGCKEAQLSTLQLNLQLTASKKSPVTSAVKVSKTTKSFHHPLPNVLSVCWSF